MDLNALKNGTVQGGTTLSLDSTIGALYLCTLFAMGLWGAACVQVYYYYKKHSGDSWGTKLLVAGVISGDTVHQGMIVHASYVYQISKFGNIAFIESIVTTVTQMLLVNALVTAAVQLFLVRRAWFLSHKSTPLLFVLSILVLAEFIITLAFYGKSLRLSIKTFPDLEKIYGLTRAMGALNAAAAVVLSGCLIFLLNRSRTGFEETETIIDRLIGFMLGTGLLTTMVAVGCLVTITLIPNSRIYIGLYYLLTKLYTNSLLASLNARRGTGCDHNGEHSPSGNSGSHPRVLKVISINGRKSANVQLVSINLDV